MIVRGKVKPLADKVIVSDMDFGEEYTASGIFLHSDNAKSSGIHPRWCKVWAIGPDQKDVKVGQWILVEHGRWTRTIDYKTDDNEVIEIRMVDNKNILAVSDDKPKDTAHRVVQQAFNYNV